MPLRPFPHPISIGTDIVSVDRIRAILTRAAASAGHHDGFLSKFLTPRERDAFRAKYDLSKNSSEDSIGIASRHLAGRWAAKEATIKAVSWRNLTFHDIIIARSESRGSLMSLILDKTESPGLADQGNGSGQGEKTDSGRLQDQLIAESQSQFPSTPRTSDGSQHSGSGERSSNVEDSGFTSAQTGSDNETLTADQLSDLSGQIARVSISHDGDYATAVCLAAEEPADGDVGGEVAARELY